MQLEAVGGVAVSDLALEVGGQVDDVDSVERAFLWANTASDTEALRDEGDLGLGSDFDTELAGTDDRAGLLALLPAFLRLALVAVDDGDTVDETHVRNALECPVENLMLLDAPSQFVRHLVLFLLLPSGRCRGALGGDSRLAYAWSEAQSSRIATESCAVEDGGLVHVAAV